MKTPPAVTPLLANDGAVDPCRERGGRHVLRDRDRSFASFTGDELWVNERPRQRLLESFGQLTIGELLDGGM